MDETNNTKKTVVLVIILVLIGLGALSFYLGSNQTSINKSDSKVEKSEGNEPTALESKQLLESKVDFKELEVKNTIVTGSVDISEELVVFLVSNALNQEIKKEVYENNSKGLSINYKLELKLIDVYKRLLSPARVAPFKVVYASRANLAFIISTESDKYNVKIVGASENENLTKVEIKVVEK